MVNQANDNVKIEGLHFKETEDKIVIYDVPIMAELVQPYSDGFAFKPQEEIQKVRVDNVPITMRSDFPGHPDTHLAGQSSDFKALNTVGFLSEPSRKKTLDGRKRYADYILYKTDLTQKVIDDYKDGIIIDTSIGFNYDQVKAEGMHDGVKYDYVQTNIVLDHNSILMDAHGNIGTGRMPAPVGGIGADSINKKIGEQSMVEKTNDALIEQVKSLTSERDSLKSELVKAKSDDVVEQMDSLKAENASLTTAKAELDAKFKVSEDELKQFKDAEKVALDTMKDELVKANPDFKDLLNEASDDLIKSYHAKLIEKNGKKDAKHISADMAGTPAAKKNDAVTKDPTTNWVNKLKKTEEAEK